MLGKRKRQQRDLLSFCAVPVTAPPYALLKMRVQRAQKRWKIRRDTNYSVLMGIPIDIINLILHKNT